MERCVASLSDQKMHGKQSDEKERINRVAGRYAADGEEPYHKLKFLAMCEKRESSMSVEKAE